MSLRWKFNFIFSFEEWDLKYFVYWLLECWYFLNHQLNFITKIRNLFYNCNLQDKIPSVGTGKSLQTTWNLSVGNWYAKKYLHLYFHTILRHTPREVKYALIISPLQGRILLRGPALRRRRSAGTTFLVGGNFLLVWQSLKISRHIPMGRSYVPTAVVKIAVCLI